MARDDTQQWDDDECQYSSRDSDDSPLLSYRHDRSRRYAPYSREIKPERERRWPVTVIAKFSLFSTAMILFCVLLYIPVYNKANDQMPKVAVAGWSVHTNRDTKIYVQPDNVTTVHEPKDVCPKNKTNKNLFLLIVVCSSTLNFERRIAIRETWGNNRNYQESAKIYHAAHEKYKHYNYSYDLYSDTNSTVFERRRRDITSFNQILPELAKVLQETVTEELAEKRFEDESDEKMLPEFDMNKEIGDNEIDYDYESNIMKIPPKGYEDNVELDKVIAKLKQVNYAKEVSPNPNIAVDFKVVFLLGLPSHDNSSEVQDRIDEEVEKYGDVIQEGFIDSYNNLTLKSIMMLKWVTNNCNDSVRYILKTDDDMYINVPYLVDNLRNRSRIHDATYPKEREYLLIGDLICGARPVLDSNNKWYSPRYMYGGRVYPRYLSGTGYVLSGHTAHALYRAALNTHYFHLEDIYITGMCSLRANPRITPRDDPGFSYNGNAGACAVHARLSAHRVPPPNMRRVARLLLNDKYVDKCERLRLTQIKKHQESRIYVMYKYLRLVVGTHC